MEGFPFGWMVGALLLLLLVSGFFSIAETSMMAINRYRLKHMAAQGHGGAQRVEQLLRRTDRL
ncbi:MAG TPA: CNNM domain-containing protein, partial [Burkholderiales bacterium]|nr:CNNM domain-containing protein [Burkholderiales bacterium]